MTSSQPLYRVVGHRGDPHNFPENSIAGAAAAARAGVDGIEVDIQLSADGVPLVIHDADLKRTGEQTTEVLTTSAASLQQLSVHEPGRYEEQFLPTPLASLASLAESLDFFSGRFFLELKEESLEYFSREQFVSAVLEASKNLNNRRVMISYDLELLVESRRQCDLPVGWVLTHYDANSRSLAETLQPEIVIVNKSKLPHLPEALWAGNWQWFVYDVIDPAEAELLAARGVRWIESWQPQGLLAARQG